ncbi:MAG: bifunctional ADP-dependent NAD(P)H-hydrate dehydratase/NAD(P)H-hydrate epimerase [Leptospiraceae bacterium]|nr:bifunctional ADP-dependent NAD(P)H-hydrate dehydratase/NAD(P)H-hydrate epimerase [Leptospiraceae bacterium]MCK6379753.1 bifunctional ADP-dependent NAD(P)H-hydrate dehydratase/NAD(P)H-hydrate epimerase [Leptospiraceae bacterium]NUM40415.1 bifunctional ADP-dependent NAD(P)H-hydrate dehydratase/NAD(P)H-hydrate epimerase [Leptospiraceae bacterium]
MEINFKKYRRPIFSNEESKNIDDFTITEFGISGTSLMGFAAISVFQKYFKLFQNKTTVLLCGRGNNGGDGLSLAYFLNSCGEEVRVFLKHGDHSSETNFYKNLLIRSEVNLSPLSEFETTDFSENQNIVFVDCLLGIGFSPPLSKEYENIIKKVNSIKKKSAKIPIISIDTISGYSPTSRKGVYVFSDILCEIGTRKIDSLFFDGRLQKTFHEIGFPKQIFKNTDESTTEFKKIPFKKIRKYLKRKNTSNKYSNGSASIIGGSEGMSGSVILSQRAFHTVGGGISKVYSNSELTISEIISKDESMMAKSLKDFQEDVFFQKSKVVLIGPGLNKNDFPVDIESIIQKEKFYIFDAGALDLIKGKKLFQNIILTPHTGEFSRLTGNTYTNFFEAYEDLKIYSKTHRVNILLKDSLSIFSDFLGNLYFWKYPNPKLSVMGSGDLLAGFLLGVLARGYNLTDSVQIALSILQNSAPIKKEFPTASQIRKYIEKRFFYG